MPEPDPDLLAQAKAGDVEARETFVRLNLGLVRSVVRRFAPRAEPGELEDLFQVGCIGLLKAIDGFEPDFGTRFSTYAVPTILGEIRRHLREGGPLKVARSIRDLAVKVRRAGEALQQQLGREPTPAEIGRVIGESPEDVVTALESLNPVASLDTIPGAATATFETEEAFLDRLVIREALARLPERQREILYWRFFRDRSQTQVAELVGLSQAQVSRIEREAFRAIRRRIEA